MRILVSGGAGYVGSVTVERLLAEGHAVGVLDDCSTGHAGSVPAEAAFSRSSYADQAAVERLLRDQGIEAILHCAARSLVGESIRDPAIYYRSNIVGGVALLEAARAAGVNRFVFSSTAAVYGVPETIPITESAPLAPINPYGESKRTFEGGARAGTARPTACAASPCATSTWPGRRSGMASRTIRRRISSRTSWPRSSRAGR